MGRIAYLVAVTFLASFALAEPPPRLQELQEKPLKEFSNVELDLYLQLRAQYDPAKDVGERIAEYALKSVGTPCDKVHPQENKNDPGVEWVATSDNLAETSSIAFVNRCIAMASAANWQEYYALLLNINFQEGVLNLANQNHFLILDWPKTASWAVTDVTDELGTPTCKGIYKYNYQDWKKHLAQLGVVKRFHSEEVGVAYRKPIKMVPRDSIVSARLKPGDIIWQMERLVIRSKTKKVYNKHMGVLVLRAGQPTVVTVVQKRLEAVPLQDLADDTHRDTLGYVVLRPKPVSRSFVEARTKDVSIMPSPTRMDAIVSSAERRVGSWFNIPFKDGKANMPTQ